MRGWGGRSIAVRGAVKPASCTEPTTTTSRFHITTLGPTCFAQTEEKQNSCFPGPSFDSPPPSSPFPRCCHPPPPPPTCNTHFSLEHRKGIKDQYWAWEGTLCMWLKAGSRTTSCYSHSQGFLTTQGLAHSWLHGPGLQSEEETGDRQLAGQTACPVASASLLGRVQTPELPLLCHTQEVGWCLLSPSKSPEARNSPSVFHGTCQQLRLGELVLVSHRLRQQLFLGLFFQVSAPPNF